MSPPLSLTIYALLFLLLFSCIGQVVHGDDHSLEVFNVESLMPAAVCSTPKAHGPNSLQIVHRHGPCSSYAGSKPSHLQTLAEDKLRVASLHARFSRSSRGDAALLRTSKVSLPAQSGTPLGTSNYVVTLGLGTPNNDQTVEFDTGSDLCWIQCRPCAASCYKQRQPVFDPSASSSYRNISCNSAACRNQGSGTCSGGTCVYSIDYADTSMSVGFLAEEKLTLTPTNVFRGFVFGCSEKIKGDFGRIAGVFGLARGTYSLASQTARRLGNAFSYCLPRTSSTTGHLTLGKSFTASVVYTAMLLDKSDTAYFIDLIGISVGVKRLPVSPTVFRSVGTIIDSGTRITRLPPLAYGALRSAFRRAMDQYPMARPVGIFDTCYDFRNAGNVSYPTITLHYDGADVTLGSAGLFVYIKASQVCLAFAGNEDVPDGIGIIGNTQQLTFEVIYDIEARKIGFAPSACD